jgi:cytochrome c
MFPKENLLKQSLPAILIVSASVLGLVSLVAHPFGEVKKPTSGKPLLAGATVDPAVVQIVERSCRSCHTDKTEWPWYSYVAPMSWLIEKDVSQGRSHMNLSHWDEYTSEHQQEILGELSAVVRSRQMPLPRYRMLHSEAKLSDSEIDQIYRWARAERSRLKSLTGGAH